MEPFSKCLQTEGELVGAGYPVVVIGTDVRTVTTGVTAADSRVILPGMKALVGVTGTTGTVLRVSDVPDPATMTYEVRLRSIQVRAGVQQVLRAERRRAEEKTDGR